MLKRRSSKAICMGGRVPQTVKREFNQAEGESSAGRRAGYGLGASVLSVMGTGNGSRIEGGCLRTGQDVERT